MEVQSSKQAMMCLIEDVDQNFRLFYTFIYASNNEDVEMEDLNSSGFQFTWTKSLLNANSSTMKKLDRVMGNEKLVEQYNQAYALFLPYLVFDHSPALLVIPHKMERKNQLDKDCHNNSLSIEAAQVLKDYNEAVKDEENMLYQQAKVDCLKEGDKNTAYFHQVVKGRRHKNHIDVVCDEQRRRFEGKEVSNQFVKHFQMFLGASRSVKEIDNIEELCKNKVSMMEAEAMCRRVTEKEIWKALKSIDDNKAPGPDG
ncbi:hypothetical protein Tco_1496355, partial [Tanacetum coccineum]